MTYEIREGHRPYREGVQMYYAATLYTCPHCLEPIQTWWDRDEQGGAFLFGPKAGEDVQAYVAEQDTPARRQHHLTECKGFGWFGSTCGRCGKARMFVERITRLLDGGTEPGYLGCSCLRGEEMAKDDLAQKSLLAAWWDESIEVVSWEGATDEDWKTGRDTEPVTDGQHWAHVGALIRYARVHNLRRGGFWHQHSGEGIPVFNTGKRLRLSMRTWGTYLWMAHEPDDTDAWGYCRYAWYTKEEQPDESQADPPVAGS